AIAVSFSVTAMAFPFMLWAQTVLGYDATEAGLLFVPMAVVTAVMAPIVGRLADRLPPRRLTSLGFAVSSIALLLASQVIAPDTPLWQLLALNALIGLGNAFLWSPLGSTATRNLPLSAGGAGSGVYHATRQVGAVLGSAAIAAAITARLAVHVPGTGDAAAEGSTGRALPAELAGPFSDAMAEAIVVPALAFAAGLVVVQFFTRPGR